MTFGRKHVLHVATLAHICTVWHVKSYHRQDKSLVVVGVLPDQVDSSRSAHSQSRRVLLAEHLAVQAPSLRHQVGGSREWTGHGGGERCEREVCELEIRPNAVRHSPGQVQSRWAASNSWNVMCQRLPGLL